MYKNKEHRARVLRAANAEPVKREVKFWLATITGICLLFIASLTLTPVIADHIDGWTPMTQCLVTILFFLSIYTLIKIKTR
jgi:hypothetical protein